MPPRRTRHVRPLLACAALALAGCAAVPAAPDAEPLPIGAWELVASNFVESGRLPGLARPTLDIAAGRLSAYSGCNRGNASVRAAEGRLAVERLETTPRVCPEPVGTFDARYFRLLRKGPVYHVDGDRLLLVAGDYNASFRKR